MKRLALTILATIFLGSIVWAQETNVVAQEKKEEKPELKTSLILFTGYSYYPSNIKNGSTNFNSFYFERAYIDFKADLKNGVYLRVTPDITETTSGWMLRLKYAYGEVKVLDILTLSLGITKTEWGGVIDDFVGLRYYTKSVGDYYRILNSADIGAYAEVKPIDGASVLLGVYDGNGFDKGSDNITTNTNYLNVTKNIGTRILISPLYILTGDKNFEKILIALHTLNTLIPDNTMTNASGQNLYGIGILVDYSIVKLAATYSYNETFKLWKSATYQNIYEILGKVSLSDVVKGLGIVGAYYLLDENADPAKQKQYITAGIEYAPNKNFIITPNFKQNIQSQTYKALDGSKVDSETSINVNVQFKY
jgi:hypothetical protein